VHSGKSRLLICLFILFLPLAAVGQIDFTVDVAEGCTPMKVKYTVTYSPDTFSTFVWDFGNGVVSNLEFPDTVIYATPGSFSPTLVFNGRGDQMIVKPDLLTVHRTVPANFDAYDSITYNFYVLQHSESLDTGVTYTFNWNVEEFGVLTGPRQEVYFPRADTFTVALTVADEFGCTSTVIRNINVLGEIVVQNAFTPNNDGINDLFIIIHSGGFPLLLKIYSRTGVLVYVDEGPTVDWNGLTASGQPLNPGIYYYTLEALSGDPDKRYSKAGFVYMIGSPASGN